MTGPFPLAFLLAMAAHGRPPAVVPPEPIAIEEPDLVGGEDENDADTMEWDGAGSDDPDEAIEECSAWVKVDCFVPRALPPPPPSQP